MSISILNRGASGGLKPELTVIAPSGSTIDLLQNGIVVSTYTLGADETEHTFVVKVGTYTVRGALEDKVQSKEMVIDAVGQYSVTIDYKLWLYREGDECEDVTGGWRLEKLSGTSASPVLTKEANRLRLQAPQWSEGYLHTNNTISTRGYSKIYVDYSVEGLGTSATWWFGDVMATASSNIIAGGSILISSPAEGTLVEDTEGTFWFGFSNTFAGYIYIHNVWLE